MRMFRCHDDDHADAVVESAVHLRVINACRGLQPGKQLALRPCRFVQLRRGVVWQHARNVLEQAAAGDVRQPFDGVLGQSREDGLHVQARGAHDGFAKRQAVQRLGQLIASPLDAFAHQRKAVAVHAVAGQAQHNITGLNGFASEQLAFFDNGYGKACQIVFASGVHARHFGGFAADQGAAAFFAAFGDAANYGCCGFHVEFAAGKVIEKKQWLGTLHQDIVHAHGHEVDAYGVVHVPLESKLELGAHAIGAADQNRFLVFLGHFKQGAKAADAGQYAFAQRFFGQGLDAFNQRIARVDVNTSVFVGNGSLHGYKSSPGKRW